MSDDEHWHLDKKVPLGIIGAIFLQTITFVWIGATWKAQIDARIERLEENDTARSGQADRLTILEQKLGFISDTVKGIAQTLDRVEIRPRSLP